MFELISTTIVLICLIPAEIWVARYIINHRIGR